MIHAGFALTTGTPEWNLDEDEAHEYAKAVAAVSRHYNINISAQALDIALLCSVAGNIYFRRIQHFMELRRQAKAQAAGESRMSNGPVATGYDPPMATELPADVMAHFVNPGGREPH